MNRFYILFIFLMILLPNNYLLAQRQIIPSDSITISGEVLHPFTLSLNNLSARKTNYIGDIFLKNHNGEPKDTLIQASGVSLIGLLQEAEIKSDKPRDLNEIYIECVATDGYKALFSWNELFNSPVGSEVYILTVYHGTAIQQLPKRIELISYADNNLGRRYVKGLKSIVVKRLAKE